MKLTRREFNKSVQVFSLSAKLHNLLLGCYEWSNRAKGFVPVRGFQEKFDVVIKTSQQLKRHHPTELFAKRLLELDFEKEKKNG